VPMRTVRIAAALIFFAFAFGAAAIAATTGI
jgi:hypothetical protein